MTRKTSGRCIQCATDYTPHSRCQCGANASTGVDEVGNQHADETYAALEEAVCPCDECQARPAKPRPAPVTDERGCSSLDHIYPSSAPGTPCFCGARQWPASSKETSCR